MTRASASMSSGCSATAWRCPVLMSAHTPFAPPAISGAALDCQAAYVSIRQHTAAYVSIRRHSSAFVSSRQHTSLLSRRQPFRARRSTGKKNKKKGTAVVSMWRGSKAVSSTAEAVLDVYYCCPYCCNAILRLCRTTSGAASKAVSSTAQTSNASNASVSAP